MRSGERVEGTDEATDVVLTDACVEAPDNACMLAALAAPPPVEILEVVAIVGDEDAARFAGAHEVPLVGHPVIREPELVRRHSVDTSPAQAVRDRTGNVSIEIEGDDQSIRLLRMIRSSISSGYAS